MSDENLAKLRLECEKCTKCELCKTRKNSVFGDGNPKAKIFFIGEAPGAREDALGKPFVGRSGKFLDEMLASVNLKRADVFIGNVLKCRPPDNRDPRPDEIEKCLPFLQTQIRAVAPKLIVTLGRFSMNLFLPDAKISQIHGQIQTVDGWKVLPLFHPAAALFDGSKRELLKNDFQILRKFL